MSIGILLLGMSACSPLGPSTMESETSDLQLTVDILRTSLQESQRTVAELRAEVNTRRQELADVQIARAQLEGRIREAERRLTEARRIIDLQREELANSRSDREQVGRASAALQNQVKQFQRQLSKGGKQAKGNVSPVDMDFPRDRQPELMTIGSQQDALSGALKGTRIVPDPAIPASGASSVVEVPTVSRSSIASPRLHMLVKPGDTLWSIARRYHTSVRHLMVLNALPSDRIRVGQALWLTEPSPDEPERERM